MTAALPPTETERTEHDAPRGHFERGRDPFQITRLTTPYPPGGYFPPVEVRHDHDPEVEGCNPVTCPAYLARHVPESEVERRVKIYIESRDWWVGYYRGDTHHYVCPLPTVVIRWRRRVR